MKIIIPMAGEGARFKEVGYNVSKPAIQTYDRRDGKLKPMVVLATNDLPGIENDGTNITYIERLFHRQDGTEKTIRDYFPKASFITVDKLTEGQACTCLLARDKIGLDDELLIAGCDNGMEYNLERFSKLKTSADVLVFTYRNNEAVLENPNAYGWMIVEGDDVRDISIKKAISESPINDHAVVATFWFRKGSIFINAAEKMIQCNDRVNNEFYVDQVIKYTLLAGYNVKVFEIDRYIGWGTPSDYEKYQKTFEYWREFCKREQIFKS